MNLHLRDKNPAVVSAWREVFADEPDVTVDQGDILELEGDAIVSPANSFGWMDGGIDDAYRARFAGIEKRVQTYIQTRHHGELPVGAAIWVPTNDLRIRNLICAPTMRVPGPVPISVNAFLAMRAALLTFDGFTRPRATSELDRTRTLLCPGLCTLTGRMRPMQAAIQMLGAWEVTRMPYPPKVPQLIQSMHNDMLVPR